jgi:ParB family chromosome partitioning protein
VTRERVEAAEVPAYLLASSPQVVSSRDLVALEQLAVGMSASEAAMLAGQTEHQVLGLCERLELWDEHGEIDAGMARIALHQFGGGTIPKPGPQIAAGDLGANDFPAAFTSPSVPKSPAPADMGIAAGAGACLDQQLLEVAIDRVLPDPANPREDLGDLTELAVSMRSMGMLQPIVVRRTAGGQLFVVAGHRRRAAAKLAGMTSVRVIVCPDMRPDDVLAAMLIENGHRKDLEPMEEARALAKLQAVHGLSEAALARKIGRPQQFVRSRLLLLGLTPQEQDELRKGDMSLTEAKQRGALAAGRVSDRTRGLPHFSSQHGLAAQAKARCIRLKHGRGKGQGVGGIACGECWESVVRADERRGLAQHAAATGHCSACGHDETPKAVAG